MDKKNKQYYSYSRPEIAMLIPDDCKKMLDVGCGQGNFSFQIKKERPDSEVWGIEINKNEAEIAKNRIDKVLIGSVEETIGLLPETYFDCIIFNDVLEHLLDPWKILNEIKGKLKNNGIIICSIPNIRHISILKKLLIDGDWKYGKEGILDKTHLRFFTKKSAVRMFGQLGYEIIKIKGINKTKWWKSILLNIFSFGLLSETNYVQFAYLIRPLKNIK